MYGEIHKNYVLYKDKPQPGHRFKQIVVEEKEQFEVHINEGIVVRTDPEFKTECSDAAFSKHPTLKSALDHAERECQHSVAAGWTLYNPYYNP